MTKKPERTCIGCRGSFAKDEVIRVITGPSGLVIDYREKLSGRAGYVCPKPSCIEKALNREVLSRAFKSRVSPPSREIFTGMLVESITARIKSYLAISVKAGKLAAGFSAVQDSLEKGRVEMLLCARDLSPGTWEKLDPQLTSRIRTATCLTRDELGRILSRELIGMMAFEDKGLADAVWKECQRLNSLINNNE